MRINEFCAQQLSDFAEIGSSLGAKAVGVEDPAIILAKMEIATKTIGVWHRVYFATWTSKFLERGLRGGDGGGNI